MALRRLRSSLFHSIIVDGKKKLLKELVYLVWNSVILSVALASEFDLSVAII